MMPNALRPAELTELARGFVKIDGKEVRWQHSVNLSLFFWGRRSSVIRVKGREDMEAGEAL